MDSPYRLAPRRGPASHRGDQTGVGLILLLCLLTLALVAGRSEAADTGVSNITHIFE